MGEAEGLAVMIIKPKLTPTGSNLAAALTNVKRNRAILSHRRPPNLLYKRV